MKDRDIVILVLCVLGGYLVLQALNHGFNLNLIEGYKCKPRFDSYKDAKKQAPKNDDYYMFYDESMHRSFNKLCNDANDKSKSEKEVRELCTQHKLLIGDLDACIFDPEHKKCEKLMPDGTTTDGKQKCYAYNH